MARAKSKLEARRALELQAPSVVQRQPVKEPLATGIKAIDCDDSYRSRTAPVDHW
jgi:F0F1-type ATP synthase alpha subunit